ncbi:MAG: ABC transporter permease [Clostridia bacterium]|nr:ABC transporter permease [Clostridia bacterium]MDE6471890.1 ABC transporter permease [Clostridia bacterium]
MIKLLRANMLRVVKSVTFWILLALYTLYPIIIALLQIDSCIRISSDKMLSLNYGIEVVPMQGLIIALLCSILFSVDFHNGTLRNKIVVGHSRTNIYLANLLTMMIISLAMSVIYIIILFALGMPILGKFTESASFIIWTIVDGSLMLMAYSSLMTLIAMTSKNSFVALIVSLLVLTAGALLAYYMDYLVSIPEVITVVYRDEFGEDLFTEMVNEYAPSKAVKVFCRFITDLLPSGQSLQISGYDWNQGWIFDMFIRGKIHYWQMALYSLGFISVTSGAGILIFKKSNLK